MNKKTPILVTGAGGQVGKELQHIAHKFPRYQFYFLTKEDLDITDQKQIQSYFSNNSFNYLINCAAYTNVDKAEDEKDSCNSINSDAPGYLAYMCEQFQTTMIHISSDYVYHPEDDLAISEDHTSNPKGTYAVSKLKGDQNIMDNMEKYIILRTSWIYSSFGHNFVKTMLKLSNDHKNLRIVNDQIGSPTYARDLADSILNIIDKLEYDHVSNPFGIYHYSNLGYISWAEFAEEIFTQKNKEVTIEKIPTSAYPTKAPRPLNSRLIKSRITETFSIKLKSWKSSLSECLEELDN